MIRVLNKFSFSVCQKFVKKKKKMKGQRNSKIARKEPGHCYEHLEYNFHLCRSFPSSFPGLTHVFSWVGPKKDDYLTKFV